MVAPLDYSKLEHQICSRGFAEVDFALESSYMDFAAQSWLAFLTLPEDTKKQFFINNAFEGVSDSIVGYVKSERKLDEKTGHPIGSTDNKEYFHFNRIAINELSTLALADDRALKFFANATNIYMEAEKTHKRIMLAFDQEFPGLYDRFFSAKVPELYLRFLKYDFDGSDRPIAMPHYDKGAFTLALAESTPGLRLHYEGCDGNFDTTYVQKHPRAALAFPGFQFQGVTEGSFLPTAHDVVPLSSQEGAGVRWSIVCFADYGNLDPVPYQAIHFDDDSPLGKHLASIPNWEN